MALLSDLPAELLDMIMKYVPNPNVLNKLHQNGVWVLGQSVWDTFWALHLTCRALYIKTSNAVGSVAFHTLQLDLDPRTLRLAQQILHDPICAPAVKKVIFVTPKRFYIPPHGYPPGRVMGNKSVLLPFPLERPTDYDALDETDQKNPEVLQKKYMYKQEQLHHELRS